ncbi:hypothetical protein AUK22_00980 [bacterium CG2_30_54_10]|nr:MAG: hypothetical protein AUK22_00980 [bacterium CG2_30_54_10]
MALTRLEKLTFTLLAIGIVIGGCLIFIKIQANNSKNRAALDDIQKISALTPRNVIEKDVDPPDLGGDDSAKLNINKATLADLDSLEGMGRAFAQRIIDYRKEKGEVKDLNELLTLKGMTKKKYLTLSRFLSVKGGKSGREGGSLKLNLNFASEEEIEKLPGIGKTLAHAIVEIRNQQGTFHSIENLRDVPGLSEEKLNRFVNLISVK